MGSRFFWLIIGVWLCIAGAANAGCGKNSASSIPEKSPIAATGRQENEKGNHSKTRLAATVCSYPADQQIAKKIFLISGSVCVIAGCPPSGCDCQKCHCGDCSLVPSPAVFIDEYDGEFLRNATLETLPFAASVSSRSQEVPVPPPQA